MRVREDERVRGGGREKEMVRWRGREKEPVRGGKSLAC